MLDEATRQRIMLHEEGAVLASVGAYSEPSIACEIARCQLDGISNALIRMQGVKETVGRTGTNPKAGCATCYSAYKYWKEKLAQPAKTPAAGREPTKWEKRRKARAREPPADAVPITAPPIVPALLNAPVKRPRYFHDADNDMRARIARQGLTAGFLGDPPPGRSALDQKEAGRS